MKVRTPKQSTGYEAQLHQYDQQQYHKFFDECKKMKKSQDKLTAAKGKALEEGYRLIQSYNIPFAIARELFPKLCNIMGNYTEKNAKLIKEQADGHAK